VSLQFTYLHIIKHIDKSASTLSSKSTCKSSTYTVNHNAIYNQISDI